MIRFYRQLTINILIALVVFVFSLFLHKGNFVEEMRLFGIAGLCYYGIHFLISVGFPKYEDGHRFSLIEISRRYSLCWLYSTVTALLIIVLFNIDFLPRNFLLLNIFGLLAGESVLVFIITVFRESVTLRDKDEITEIGTGDIELLYPFPKDEVKKEPVKEEKIVIPQENQECLEYALNYLILPSETSRIIDTADPSVILGFPAEKYDQIVNFHKLNRINNINKFMGTVNSRLPFGGLMMICAETSVQRKARILKKYPPVINRVFYAGDYFLMRILPNIPVIKKIHDYLTRGENRVISRPEILGRLISCGFGIVAEQKTSSCFLVICRKIKLPAKNSNTAYGPLIHLNRVGKEGKMIKIFKIRTMYPYSEYIQEYIYDQNKLAPGGKIKDDYRVTPAGRFLRRFWIDEIPGLWNWLRGDVKLVGVRPLSRHYYDLYTPKLQQARVRFKPGLIPPFYVDLPKTLPEIMDSELRYLELYAKAPLKTDFHYFWKAVFNIVFKGAKSY